MHLRNPKTRPYGMRTGGDPRIGHFIGMHHLQIIPSIGYFLSRPRIAQHTGRPVTWFWMLALGYSLVALLHFLQALAGQPLIQLSGQ